MQRLFLLLRKFVTGNEPLVFVAVLMIVLGVWAFAELLENVRGGDTMSFDTRVLKFFRNGGEEQKLIGPHWVESVVRDVTALGGAVVLGLVVFSVAGFLAF